MRRFSSFSGKVKLLFISALVSSIALPGHAAKAEEDGPEIIVASNRTETKAPPLSLNGWNYLAALLIENNVPERRAYEILSDPRMPIREAVYFKVFPKESKALYRKHNTARNRKLAREYYATQKAWLDRAESRYGIPSSVILALLQVETSCGRHVGRDRVFPRLARLAAIAEPGNIASNIEEQQNLGNESNPALVAERARHLEATFLPHLIAGIRLSDDLGIHPLDLRGSSGGAIGIPQFLPGNVYTYGADADGDGRIDLFSPPDAIYSTARFLSESGWKGKMSLSKQKSVLLKYNRSTAYADTILSMAGQLRKEIFGTHSKSRSGKPRNEHSRKRR